MDPLVTYLFPPQPKHYKADDSALILRDQCQSLIRFALGFWEHVIVTNRKDYQDKMRLLVYIDYALHYACAPGMISLSNLQTQVQIVDDEARRILEMVVWARLDYDSAPTLNLVGGFGDHDEEVRGLGRDTLNTLTSLGDAIKIYIHTELEHPPVVPTYGDLDNESKERAVEEALLDAYRDGFSVDVGILNSPMIYYLFDSRYGPDRWSHATHLPSKELGFEDTTCIWQESIVSCPPYVLVGTNPRIHLLTSFEPNPQLYSLAESMQEHDILFKDRRGAVRSFLDIQKRHGPPRKLYLTLYQLRAKAEELDTSALVSVDLRLIEEQMGAFQPEMLLDIWQRILKLEKQPGKVPGTSWLLDVGEFSFQSTAVPYYRKFASEYGLNVLSELWGCQLCSPGVEQSPVSHSVLGSVHFGLMLYPAQHGSGPYGGDHFLSFFAKDLASIRINCGQVEFPQDLNDDPMTRLIRRWDKYRHPNVLSLFGIQQLPYKRIGVVLSQTHTNNLSEYLDTTPVVDRCRLCVQISSGLAYLHKAGVIHGNLKASNILVSLTGEAIISDPLVLEENTPNKHVHIRWMAPEVVQGKPASVQSDVYSLGMTILEVISAAPPYTKISETELLDAILSGPGFLFPDRPEDSIPTDSKQGDYLWGLLELCWSFNHEPKNRPNLKYVNKSLRLITQAGLQQASQEEIASQLFRSRVLQEASYELSDTESVSSPSSNSSASGVRDTDTKGPLSKDQGSSNSTGQEVAREIIRRLALHGCENLTDHIDADSFAHLPHFRGGFGDVYRGSLLGGLIVAIKTPHISLNVLDENPEYLKVCEACTMAEIWSFR